MHSREQKLLLLFFIALAITIGLMILQNIRVQKKVLNIPTSEVTFSNSSDGNRKNLSGSNILSRFEFTNQRPEAFTNIINSSLRKYEPNEFSHSSKDNTKGEKAVERDKIINSDAVKNYLDERHPDSGSTSSQNSFWNCSKINELEKDINISSEPYVPLQRLVHFDLKGAPPKIDYLMKLLPLIKRLGATGILIEYEDMFPYDGLLSDVAAKNHYTKEEIQSLLTLAKEYELETIPLVQTFGHMEFVLKLKSYQHLREDPDFPQAICPSLNDSLKIIKELIDQVIFLHPDSKWIHIGCDEVFQLGVCPICSKFDRSDLFLQHIVTVASYVREKYSVIPIMWDDMLHRMSVKQLRSYKMGNLVEPMMWTYVSPVYFLIGHQVWSKFSKVFPYVWGASAFKGAFGPGISVPNIKQHLDNNIAWLEAMKNEDKNFCEIRGLALTGWQRYDHFASLCELLPTGIPSLAINLLAVFHGYFNSSLHPLLLDYLNCSTSTGDLNIRDPDIDNSLFKFMEKCSFPGVDVFKIVYNLETMEKRYQNTLKNQSKDDAWITEYNIRHNFSSIARIKNNKRNIHMLRWTIENYMKQSWRALSNVYDEYTAAEWIEQKIYPMWKYLKNLEDGANSMLHFKTWPARPFKGLMEIIEVSKKSRRPVP